MRGAALTILVIDENRLRTAIIEEGLREAGHDAVTVIHDVMGIAARIGRAEEGTRQLILGHGDRALQSPAKWSREEKKWSQRQRAA